MRGNPVFKQFISIFGICICCLISVTGCSQSSGVPVKEELKVSSNSSEKVIDTNTPVVKKEAVSLMHTDEKGRKWIGDVPYDVFEVYFDEPLQVASNTQPSNMVVANNSAGNANAGVLQKPVENATAVETKPMTDNGAVSVGGDGWKQLISHEVLMSEVKRIRNEISAKLKSVGEYNNSFAEIEILGGTLAAMAIIAYHHEEAPNWREKALAVRDLAGEVAEGANGGRGRENYEKCQKPFEKIIVILDGSSPPDLKIPENKEDWYASADTKHLMKRMEASQAWLRLNVQNDKDFKGKVAEISLENSVMGALTKVIRHSDYAYADEEAYQNLAKELMAANQSISKSVTDGNFELYQSATGGIEKACAACHLKYRFE